MAVSLSWEEAVTKCDLNLLTSYENPVIVLNEIETNTDIKGYHTYMNSWKTIIGENMQTYPKPEDIMSKYTVAVLKDTRVARRLTKVRSERCAKIIFYFLWANQSNSAVVTVKGKRTNYGDGQSLQIPFPIEFIGEAKCIKILQERLTLYS